MFSLQILFSIIASAVFATEENFNSSNSILRENKRLTDQTVKTVVSSSLLSCSQACLRRSWCTSTNFNSLKKSNEGNCELNKHKFSPITDDSKLTDEPGTTFTMLLKVRNSFLFHLNILTIFQRVDSLAVAFPVRISFWFLVLKTMEKKQTRMLNSTPLAICFFSSTCYCHGNRHLNCVVLD